ncbi:MAG: flagellar export chaperone FliS [Myxococcales bacterium]|nr:flagellar export chaperone FliS [Myxococcales bacterium]
MLTGIERYKAVHVKTSAPGDVLNMLFDGIFRFSDEAIEAIARDDRARTGDRIGRAHAILTELASTLNKEACPELCDNLEAVYFFCMTKLIEANLYRDAQRIEEVKRALDPIRDGFRVAVAEAGRERGAA